ncbi:hypothetical protein F2P81_008603 [Scophthalmus maximus]|uniref:Uncharacterized protein n=1 Tax=Scophthalmus maximus TaxID=52904 RepID=A0A6A4SZF9_SCOMX|nr:hypothetical protein F2P81_008603 [Scophthalmus maximus]
MLFPPRGRYLIRLRQLLSRAEDPLYKALIFILILVILIKSSKHGPRKSLFGGWLGFDWTWHVFLLPCKECANPPKVYLCETPRKSNMYVCQWPHADASTCGTVVSRRRQQIPQTSAVLCSGGCALLAVSSLLAIITIFLPSGGCERRICTLAGYMQMAADRLCLDRRRSHRHRPEALRRADEKSVCLPSIYDMV